MKNGKKTIVDRQRKDFFALCHAHSKLHSVTKRAIVHVCLYLIHNFLESMSLPRRHPCSQYRSINRCPRRDSPKAQGTVPTAPVRKTVASAEQTGELRAFHALSDRGRALVPTGASYITMLQQFHHRLQLSQQGLRLGNA